MSRCGRSLGLLQQSFQRRWINNKIHGVVYDPQGCYVGWTELMFLSAGVVVLSIQQLNNRDGSSVTRSEASSTKVFVDKLRMCGPWCLNQESCPCRIDTSMVPCSGEYCRTSCAIWNQLVLHPGQRRPSITCDQYKRAQGYFRGTEPCPSSCLPLELSPNRYPGPTGVGLLCVPGTCQPAATLADFDGPCNWYATTSTTSCRQDLVPVSHVTKVSATQQFFDSTVTHKEQSQFHSHPRTNVVPEHANRQSLPQRVLLHVGEKERCKIMKDYQPGSVVRILQFDSNDKTALQEAVAAVVVDDSNPTSDAIEILLGPPDSSRHPDTTAVHRRIYQSLPWGKAPVKNLYITPVIGNFFNQHYRSFVDVLHEPNSKCTHVVIVSSGSALGGALSAVDAALAQNKRVYFIYGIRTAQDIPYLDRLERLSRNRNFAFILVESSSRPSSENAERRTPRGNLEGSPLSLFLQEAIQQGACLQILLNFQKTQHHWIPKNQSIRPSNPDIQKFYAQDALGVFLDQNPNLVDSTALFVICGRSEVLLGALEVLRGICSDSVWKECIFTNI